MREVLKQKNHHHHNNGPCGAAFAATTAALMPEQAGSAEQQGRSQKHIYLHMLMLQDMLTVKRSSISFYFMYMALLYCMDHGDDIVAPA